MPTQVTSSATTTTTTTSTAATTGINSTATTSSGSSTATATNDLPSTSYNNANARPGSMVRVPEFQNSSSTSQNNGGTGNTQRHSRNSSWDLRVSYNGNGMTARNNPQPWAPGHSRTTSLDLRHSRNSSVDLNKYNSIRNDLGMVFNQQQISGWADPLRVQIIKAHHNWISVAYAHFVTCYRLKDSSGWQHIFTSQFIESIIERIAINAKMNLTSSGEQSHSKMIAISYGTQIRLWGISDDGTKVDVGIFNLNVRVEYLFFIGSQLVALSSSGKIGVWHSMTQHWQIQDLVPILSFDTAGSFLLLGCNNGSIYYIGKEFENQIIFSFLIQISFSDMQKFPLRMKDNDLLVTELYKDPSNDHITAISVYLTPKTTSKYMHIWINSDIQIRYQVLF